MNNNLFNRVPAQDPAQKIKNRSTFNYMAAVGVLAVGMTYAAVPLYRMFCQVIIYFYN